MSWWIPDYEPSDHEQIVETLYAEVDSGERKPLSNQTTLFICFTNRCGSNFLAAALASTGSVKPAREYLNHPMIRRRSERLGIVSFDGYLRQIAEEFTHKGILTLKAGLRQLYYLAKLGFIGELLPNPRFVHIERNDVVAQAVSWVLAVQSGQWMSSQEAGEGRPQYDFEAIDDRVTAILEENAAFKAFLGRNGCPAEFVRYESLRRDPTGVIRDLTEALGLGQAEYHADRIKIESQSSDINAEWKMRYLDEVSTA